MNKNIAREFSHKLIFEEMEVRQLFSAGIADLVVPEPLPLTPPPALNIDITSSTNSTAQTTPPPSPTEASTQTQNDVRQELVFVDTAVKNYQELLNDIYKQSNAERNIQVVLLDNQIDGIQQISQVLSQYKNLDAIHLITHGSDGSIDMGNSQLNFESLVQNQDAVSAWGNALTKNGDFLIYGCNVAETQFGQSFVDYFSSLTKTDVAASEDATGNSALGGDWTLEYQTGAIETQNALSASEQNQWNNLLAISSNGTVTSAQNQNTNSLTWSHTVNSGTNRVLFVELSINGVSAIANSVTYGGVSMTLVGRAGGNHGIEIWRLINPTVGTANVVASLAGATPVAGGAATFNGVNQTTPTGTFVSATGTSTTASVTVASATGDVVMDVQYWVNTGANIVGAGQTSQWSRTTTDNSMLGGSTTEAGAASVTMSSAVNTSSQWEIGAVSIKAAAANSSPVNTMPSAQTTNEDTAKVFSSGNGNQISIADTDAGGANNQVTISVTNGTLTLAGIAGLSFTTGDGTADATMTLRGTASAINTALNGLSFSPTTNYSGGTTLTLATKDSTLLSLDIDTGLVGRYDFENTGALGTDTSPAAGYAGTVSGATAVNDGTRGNVISMAGASYVQTAGHFGNPANVTLSAWINLTSADTTAADVISLGDSVVLRLDNAGVMNLKKSVEFGVIILGVRISGAKPWYYPQKSFTQRVTQKSTLKSAKSAH
ncbi:MAG: DUF4347 domain-containing protein [Methylococcaceae bacterium]